MRILFNFALLQGFGAIASLFFGISTVAAQETLSVSVLNGTEIRCYPDSLVRIEISPNTSFQFATIYLDWGDGSPVVELNPGDPLILEHEFPIAQFEDDCTYGEGCPGFASNGFCFTIAIDAVYGTATTPENISKRITFIFPPRPNLTADNAYICAGNEVMLRNLTCPENDEDMRYYWLLPDGTTSTEEEPVYTFPMAGVYPVTLTAVNTCDSISTTSNITVNELPIAVAVLDSGSVAFQNDRYIVCLSDGGRVRLNGDSSEFATTYFWTISPANGFIWQGTTTDDSTNVQFNTPGIYTATLEVDNDCDQPDVTTLTIEVLPVLSLSLLAQPDECLSFDYSPSPLLAGVTYLLNGTNYTSTDFPVTLTTNAAPYTVTASINSICDALIRHDTFFVFGQSDPTITTPAMDTSTCRDTSLILLETDFAGGSWIANSGLPLVVQNGQTFFNSNQPNGNYLITYTLGSGACEGNDTRTITIQSPDVSVMPLRLCENSIPDTLTFNPSGGTWQGPGIIDPALGVFDPSVVEPDTYPLYYTFDDATGTGCMVTLATIAEVVALPEAMNVPDTFSLCDVDAVLSLPDLTNINFSPEAGTTMWSGQGIVNNNTGAYNPNLAGATTDTVSFIYTITPNCAIRDTFVLTIDEIPLVDAGLDTTICDSADNPLLSATPAGIGRWLGTGINENTGEIDLSQLTAGNTYSYIYIINESFAPCTNSDTVQVTLAGSQGVSVMPNELYLCDTASVLTFPLGTPNTGSWMGLPGITGNQLDVSTLSPGTYALSYVDLSLPEGCNSANLTLHFEARPEVGITNDSTACVNIDCLEFFANTTNATAFQWLFGDGATSSQMNACHTYFSTGEYAVSLTGYLINPLTNTRYCTSLPATTTVDILGPIPPTGIDASITEGCPDVVASFSPMAVIEHVVYSWTTLSIVNLQVNELNGILFPAAIEDTTYQVQMIASNGCTIDTIITSVTALAPFRADIGTDYDFPCSGETIAFYNRSTGTSGNVPLWIFSDGTTYQGFDPPPFEVFTDSLPGILELMLIDSNTCNADTAFYQIEIQPTDVRARMNYSGPDVCANANLLLINASTPNVPIRWVTSDGNNYLGDTVLHQFQTPGPAWVTIYAYGCGYDSLRYEFYVQPPPEIGLSYDPFVCAQEESTFVVTGNAAGQVLYFGNGDSTLMNISSYAYPVSGSYNLHLISRSSQGCVDSLARTITIGLLPEAIVGPVDSVCAGESVLLYSTSIDAQSCVWQFADGGSRDACITSYVFNSSGIQTTRLIVTSPLGCKDSMDFPVFVRPTPIAAFSYISNSDCSPSNVQFLYTPSSPLPTSWNWNFGDSNNSILANSLHTYLYGGTYDVALIVGIDGICFDTLMQAIEVKGTPEIDTLVTDNRCLPEDAFVLEVFTDEANEITVIGDDFFQTGISRFEIVPAGNYRVEVRSPLGCDTVLTFTIPQVFPLMVQLMPDTTILLGDSVSIISNVNAANVNFTWDPIINLNDTSLLEPIAKPGETTVYVLSIFDGSCTAADTVTIFVDENVSIYFPNAFSPNGDGFNDTYNFYPVIGVAEVLSFQIFHRWGGRVWFGEDLKITTNGVQTWDGNLNDKPVNSAMFVFLAKLKLTNGKILMRKGEIYLVK